jgi:hypothetical protein
MDIQHAPAEASYETFAQHAHEPGQHDEIRLVAIDLGRKCIIEGLA